MTHRLPSWGCCHGSVGPRRVDWVQARGAVPDPGFGIRAGRGGRRLGIRALGFSGLVAVSGARSAAWGGRADGNASILEVSGQGVDESPILTGARGVPRRVGEV